MKRRLTLRWTAERSSEAAARFGADKATNVGMMRGGARYNSETRMQRKVSEDATSRSAARIWAPLARFIDWEADLGEKAEARGRAAHFAYEFVRFGVKQAWACLFGALLLG